MLFLFHFLAYLVFKDHISKKVFVAAIVAVIGLYSLTMSGTLTVGIGEFLTLICAFLFALQIIYTKFSKEVNVFFISTISANNRYDFIFNFFH